MNQVTLSQRSSLQEIGTDASDPLMTRFPISQSTLDKMSPEEYYRIMFMSWIGPVLVEGELWIVHPRDQETVLGAGIWAVSGKTLSDTSAYLLFSLRLIISDTWLIVL